MKRTITTILVLALVTFAAGAQTDIKNIEGKTGTQITRITGTPSSKDLGDSFPDVDIYEYSDTRFGILRDTKKIDFFVTKSTKYCVLSGLIPGGIRVGDSLSKLRGFDFAGCAYGRGKPSNAFKGNPGMIVDLMGYDSNYVIFEDEYHTIYIAVRNNKVVAWSYGTKADAPYEPYDASIRLW